MHEQRIIDDILKNTDRANCIYIDNLIDLQFRYLAERLGKDYAAESETAMLIERSIGKAAPL